MQKTERLLPAHWLLSPKKHDMIARNNINAPERSLIYETICYDCIALAIAIAQILS